MKTEVCSFSGAKIYPSKGIRFIRGDSKVFVFLNAKNKRYFHQGQKSAKFRWTLVYRRLHKKGVSDARARRRKRVVRKVQKAVVGLDMEQLKKIKRETPDKAKERREANLKELRDRRAKSKTNQKKSEGAQGGSKAPKQKGAVQKGR
eukprot:TRINITY_DN3683_c0_g1_i1.p1 TRINITY_DN3683_c0_g1~~TRINITY_DN3683_c0_g1_i1.p1  ORF type:complete len:147 (-),score=37.48 TRINITY_DN3683_c0_g1_i1:50-490(-)